MSVIIFGSGHALRFAKWSRSSAWRLHSPAEIASCRTQTLRPFLLALIETGYCPGRSPTAKPSRPSDKVYAIAERKVADGYGSDVLLNRPKLYATASRQPAHRPSYPHEGRIVADSPNQIWGTDATATCTEEEGQVTIFAAIDHYSADCIGIHAV